MLRDDKTGGGGQSPARNVLGEPIEICWFKPMTGFYRDGCCNTIAPDRASQRLMTCPNSSGWPPAGRCAGAPTSTLKFSRNGAATSRACTRAQLMSLKISKSLQYVTVVIWRTYQQSNGVSRQATTKATAAMTGTGTPAMAA